MERLLDLGDVELCAEAFGDPADPTVLLIMGLAASMLHWDEQFCERLAAGGRYVIRYDHRDTGRSTTCPPGEPNYTGDDLTADALRVLDAFGVDRAHLVGMSAGGGIAQEIALDHPQRVRTLTLQSTTPIGRVDADLPGMSDELAAVFSETGAATASADPVEAIIDGERPFHGVLPFDEERWRDVATRSVARSRNVDSAANNFMVEQGSAAHDGLGRITVPTLVMHGTHDPLFPLPHGEALAAAIPGARFLVLDGVGHEPPPRSTYDLVVPALLDHTAT